jgi:hypothetical protein
MEVCGGVDAVDAAVCTVAVEAVEAVDAVEAAVCTVFVLARDVELAEHAAVAATPAKTTAARAIAVMGLPNLATDVMSTRVFLDVSAGSRLTYSPGSRATRCD